MHDFAQFLSALTEPLVSGARTLSPLVADIGGQSTGHGDFAVAALLVSAAIMVLVSGLSAIGLRMYFIHRNHGMELEIASLKTAILFRDTVIASGADAVVILSRDSNHPLNYGRGSEMLQECLAGPQAAQLASAIESLLSDGIAFNCSAKMANGRIACLRGRPIGGKGAIFAVVEDPARHANLDFQEILDALPLPVWLRDKNLNLKWGNQAFVKACGKPDLQQVLDSNIALDRTERDMALSASEGNETFDAKRYISMGGERRVVAFRLRALKDHSLAGMAVDLTEAAGAEAKLQMDIEAYGNVLDQMPSAIAIFGANQKLDTFNRAYAQLWNLPEQWLRQRPTQGEILDAQRAARKLPEQRDFAAWKNMQIQMFHGMDAMPEEIWHLPGGQSIKKTMQRHPLGGVTVLFEDVSNVLQMQSSYNSLLKVQRATLDTMHEGVAVFGMDGCLKIYNTAFQKMWKLEESELQNEPHLKSLALCCIKRIGRDETWTIISAGINAENPEKYNDWASIMRTDGQTISLSLTRLPDGGTMVTFSNVTNYLRFESGLRMGMAAAA